MIEDTFKNEIAKDTQVSCVFEDEKWLVIVPYTREAVIKYGKGTQWCTSATTSDNYFDKYDDEGKLYIVIDKQSGHKLRFHFKTQSFMDENNKPIRKDRFFKENDKDGTLVSFFKKERPNGWLSLIYDYADNFYGGWARVKQDGKWNFVNNENRLIRNDDTWFKGNVSFYNGWACVQREDEKMEPYKYRRQSYRKRQCMVLLYPRFS